MSKEEGLDKETLLKIIKWISENSKYDYYYDDRWGGVSFKEALEMERRYELNCTDGFKDLSPRAVNQRILNYMKQGRIRKWKKE